MFFFSFPFSTLEYHASPFWPASLLLKNLLIVLGRFPCTYSSFSLSLSHCSSDSHSVFKFWQFDNNVLQCRSSWFITIFISFRTLSFLNLAVSFSRLRNSLAILIWRSFLSLSVSLPLLELLSVYWIMCIFSFCSSDWVNFTALSSSLLINSSLDLTCCWTLMLNFSMQVLHSSPLQFLFDTFLYFLSLLKFMHFIHALFSWPLEASL